jgi:multidrug efflux pump subunit AcrB
MLAAYRRTLDIVLQHPRTTLGVFFATMALMVVLYVEIPKGFFPIQDTGMINGLAEAAQDVSPAEMMRLQRELGGILLRDPILLVWLRRPEARAAMATRRPRIPRAFSSP